VRPGTENVAGIVGFGLAARAASRQVESERERLRALRDRLWRGMRAGLSGVHLNGSLGCSLPNTLNVSFAGLNGDALMRALDRAGVAVSTGSACAVGAGVRSHVLDAMRVGPERLCGPIRFSLGYGTTVRDVDRAVSAVLETVTLMRRAGACCCCG
jgi:cysteine desulfurase